MNVTSRSNLSITGNFTSLGRVEASRLEASKFERLEVSWLKLRGSRFNGVKA